MNAERAPLGQKVVFIGGTRCRAENDEIRSHFLPWRGARTLFLSRSSRGV